MGNMRNSLRILDGKPKGKRSLGRHRHMYEDNIRTDLTETGLEVVDWIHLAKDTDQRCDLVNTVMNLRVPYKAGNFLTR
jgi:hypothetical protein